MAAKHYVTDEDRSQVTDMFFQPLESLPNIRKNIFNLDFVTMLLFFHSSLAFRESPKLILFNFVS